VIEDRDRTGQDAEEKKKPAASRSEMCSPWNSRSIAKESGKIAKSRERKITKNFWLPVSRVVVIAATGATAWSVFSGIQ
jgi:hypothetical protein